MVTPCSECVFRNMDCLGDEAIFILEVLIRIRPEIQGYCFLFDAVRIEAYRQLQEHMSQELRASARPGEAD